MAAPSPGGGGANRTGSRSCACRGRRDAGSIGTQIRRYNAISACAICSPTGPGTAARPAYRAEELPKSRTISLPSSTITSSIACQSWGRAAAVLTKDPERITAVAVIVGSSPLEPDEVSRLVGVNAAGYAAAERGWDSLHDLLLQVRIRILGDEGMAGVLADAPPEDRAIMANPTWQKISRAVMAEALRQGAEGWADESMALHNGWDFDPDEVHATVTWWAGDDDKNVPLSAAKRAAARLPKVDLRVWHNEGHFASLTHETEIVRELLSRSA